MILPNKKHEGRFLRKVGETGKKRVGTDPETGKPVVEFVPSVFPYTDQLAKRKDMLECDSTGRRIDADVILDVPAGESGAVEVTEAGIGIMPETEAIPAIINAYVKHKSGKKGVSEG